jgi:hypothetical protein
MAKGKANGFGCLFLLACLGGGYATFKQSNPALHGLGMILLAVFAIGFLVVAVMNMQPKECGVCHIQIKKQSYPWTIGGEKKVLCPNCNRTFEKKQSREATRRYK